ncbi:MAG: acetyltransferase [Methylacidiphilales bacterium]|nr:acetyltransferase [Candidatus Methylacidiphilales bacterium]NJR19675.1 acetyltransferase [Calothrix sp. CSU_2_0]
MLLQAKDSGSIVEILDIQELINPVSNIVKGQNQLGQEEQDPTSYKKENLVFPSGESLPRCWVDANYRK